MKSIMMSLTAMRLSLAQAGFLLAMVLLASPVRSTDLVLETVWDSLRPIEEYRHEVGSSEPPRLIARRTYGLGLEEVVKLELDVDGDGTLTEYLPFYDSTGNLALITDVTGKPIERYSYSPHGERTIRVHSTPPTVEQVRVEAGQLVIELSEETSGEALVAAVTAGTLRLLNVTTGQTIAIAIDRPVLTGRAARRRLVITGTDPPETTAWPQPGESVELVVGTAALVDLFANQAVAEYRQTCSWPVGELLVDDATAPRLEQVCVLSGRLLELTFSEKVDAALAAGEILLNGAAVAWQQEGADGYTLRTAAPLAAGSYTLSLGTGPLDLADLGLSAAVSESFAVVETSPERLIFSTPLPGQVASPTIGNVLGFHGLPEDLETGLLYVRHRYYDPELGRFITADPMGYVDAPNLYQFALNNPANFWDPTGEVVIPCAIAGGISALAGWGINAAFGLEYGLSDAALDFSLGALTCGAGGAIQGLTKVGKVGRVALTASADVGATLGVEGTRAFLHGQDVSTSRLLRGAVVGAGIGHAVRFGGGRLLRGLRARFSTASAIDDVGPWFDRGFNYENYGSEFLDDAPSSVSGGARGKDIVLGNQRTLRSTARKTGGFSYHFWKREGLSDVNAAYADTPEAFEYLFDQAVARSRAIHFSLDRLSLRRAALDGADPLRFTSRDRYGAIVQQGNATSWELFKVIDNPKVVFYQNGRVVPRARVFARLGVSK